MTMTGDFLHEIEDALDRRADNGALWCPEECRRNVEFWVTVRDESFYDALLQLMRLVRAMQLADALDYSSFLYLQLNTLRGRSFARAFGTLDARRRLAGRVAVDDDGLRFLEPTMWLPPEAGVAARPFALSFAQMPPLAALLDVLHTGLGFGPVAEILTEVTRPMPGEPIVAVRSLRQAWDGWLKGRIQSEHFAKKANAIRQRLDPARAADFRAIDDAFILETWRALSPGNLDGFRLLPSAARTAIRYRQALRIAQAERQLRDARRFGAADDPGAVDIDRVVSGALETSQWISPLPALAGPPDNPVKWFKNRKDDLAFLDDHLGATDVEDDLDETGGSLSGPEPYDFAFGLTLLRCMLFGPLQRRLSERLKRGGFRGAEDWDAATVLPEAGYDALRERYEELAANVDRVCRAAAAILLRSGTLAPLELLVGDPDPVIATWLAGLREAAGGDVTSELLETEEDRGNVVDLYDRSGLLGAVGELAAAFANSRAAPEHLLGVVQLLRTATDKFERGGFSSRDRTNPEIVALLQEGVDPVIRLRQALRSAIDWYALARPNAMFDADRTVLVAHLRQLYFDSPG